MKTVVQELIEEQEKNKALEAKLKTAQADAAKATIAAAVPTKAAGMTEAQAQAEYAKLPAEERKAFRQKNWKLLGCNEER